MCCPLVFEFSVGIGGFVIGLGQISFFFSFFFLYDGHFSIFRTKFEETKTYLPLFPGVFR